VDLRRAFHGICGIDRDHMFVHMIPVHMAEMAVVKIIHVAVMVNRSVPAFRAMLMSVVGVVYLGACGPLAMLPVSAWLPIDAPPFPFRSENSCGTSDARVRNKPIDLRYVML
jgi:hypothetical protein